MAGQKYQILLFRSSYFMSIISGAFAGAALALFIIPVIVGTVDIFAGSESGIILVEIVKKMFLFFLLLGAGFGVVGAFLKKRKAEKEEGEIGYIFIVVTLVVFLGILLTISSLSLGVFPLSLVWTIASIAIFPFLFALPVSRFYSYLHEIFLLLINKRDVALQKEMFAERLDMEFGRLRRYGGKLCFALVGMQNKEEIESLVNPQNLYKIKKEMLNTLQKNMRKSDIFSLWEEDRIGSILIGTPEENVPAAISHIRDLIIAHIFWINDMRIKVVPVFGFSNYDKSINSKEELVRMAEENLKENMMKK